MSSPTTKAVVLGSGSWGTALAIVLSEHFEKVLLIGRSDEQAEEINSEHKNHRYLPKINLPKNIRCSTDLTEVKSAEVILFVVPTSATRETSFKLAEIADC